MMKHRSPRLAARRSAVTSTLWLAALLLPIGCASAPPAGPPAPSFEQKMSWILRLEDQRVLRDPAPPPPAPPAVKTRRGTPPPAPPVPDLLESLVDPDRRVRRRAALAVGRVGLAAGAKPLATVLAGDVEPEVRQMAAFALGLLGRKEAIEPLRAALADSSLLVQGRAAEALSVLGDQEAARTIAALVAAQSKAEAAAVAPDDTEESHPPAVEAFRLGVLALGRMKAYDALASAVLDASGQPTVRWWPVAAAFQRTEDRRALGVLRAFAGGESPTARAFAAKGLGALKDPAAIDVLVGLAENWPRDTRAALSAVRALGQIGDQRAAPALMKLLRARDVDPLLFLEVVSALGQVRATGALESLLDLLSHRSAPVRAAALRSVRDIDPPGFMLVLSGLDPDRDWSVRASLASVLGTLEPDAALPRLTAMLKDADQRVVPSVLAALRSLKAPGIDKTLLQWLGHEDAVIRAAAATGLGQLKAAGAEPALVQAWRSAAGDRTYVARGAILAALAQYGRAAAEPTLREALGDPDYAVRVRAASLLETLAPGSLAETDLAIRPAPTRHPPEFYTRPELVTPSVSPRLFIDTERGTIEVELAVLDAPLTCASFTALAGAGFFNGLLIHRVVPNFVVQDGDPRGDGEGGPGYTIRDEISQRPYLRGTVGVALDWAETGGSQFFITHSPQPHLDGRYTVIGRVVAGMEIVDRLQQWDVIKQLRVWDGKTMTGGRE